MDTDNNTQQDLDQDKFQDQGQETNQTTSQKKSKEENFDGVVKKLNAKEKEVKKLSQQLQGLESKIAEQQTQATTSQENMLAKLQSEIDNLKNERQQEVFQNKLEKALSKASIENKFARVAKSTLQDIATDNNLDLTDPGELEKAIGLLTTEYPEFIAKKPKKIGIANGQTPSNNPAFDVLDDDMQEYFKLPKEQREALKKKIYE
jgi:Glu-tRNA(Gln) amidotransferase subunit E-like FAD-binding protein